MMSFRSESLPPLSGLNCLPADDKQGQSTKAMA